MKKTLFAIIVFIVAFAIPVAVYSLFTRGDAESGLSGEGGDVRVGGEEGNSAPLIRSIPPTKSTVGNEYVYKVKASDKEGDIIEYRPQTYPAWMEWDETLMTLHGIPVESDVGSHAVEIWVTDGSKVNSQKYEVDVSLASESGSTETEEGSQVGEEDVSPMISETTETYSTDEDEALSFHGLSAGTGSQGDQTNSIIAQSSEGAVLGVVTQLPETAIFGGAAVIILGGCFLSVAVFVWADGRWNLSRQFFSSVNYARGKQVKMEMESGVIVKKKSHRL